MNVVLICCGLPLSGVSISGGKEFSISETKPDNLEESHLEPQKNVHRLTCNINELGNIRDIKKHI